ncbi:MAG: hypothetical protein QOE27_1480, partial [Solirubrobacteraceae bacterium]|nr:hypothetical protein [Solirubrobacteraceae bacterium]
MPTGAGQDRSSSNGRGSGRRSSPKPGRAPKGPTDIRRGAWGGVLKRT